MRFALLLIAFATAPAAAQDLIPGPSNGPRRLSGPRTGLTWLSPGVVASANEAAGDTLIAFPVVTQLGWQVETRVFQLDTGWTGVTEAVLLLGGLDKGIAIPSVTFLTGIRAPSGVELGVGPNLTVAWGADGADDVGEAGSYAKLGLAVAVGISPRIDDVNLPLNVAAVRGEDGWRLSALVGFNVSTHRY